MRASALYKSLFLLVLACCFGTVPVVNAALSGLEGSVSLTVVKGGIRYTCSGALIDSLTVVTAGHCLDQATDIYVSNERRVETAQNWHQADDWRLHPNYAGNDLYSSVDMGVVKLRYPIYVDTYFTPTAFNDVAQGEVYLERVGYGGRNMVSKGSHVNQENIRTLVSGSCSEFTDTGLFKSFTDEYGYEGDSGGPVFIRVGDKIALIGIHSGRAVDQYGNLMNVSNFLPMTARRIQWLRDAFLPVAPVQFNGLSMPTNSLQ